MAMRKGDPQGPTRAGLPSTMGPCQPLEGRWCNARRVPEGLCAWSEEDLIPCGGELLCRRRREAGLIVTYLVCQFCGDKTPMLSCDGETLQHADLTAEPAHVTLARRRCDFCGRLKLPDELMIGALRGRPGFGVGCKGGCAPKGAMLRGEYGPYLDCCPGCNALAGELHYPACTKNGKAKAGERYAGKATKR